MQLFYRCLFAHNLKDQIPIKQCELLVAEWVWVLCTLLSGAPLIKELSDLIVQNSKSKIIMYKKY